MLSRRSIILLTCLAFGGLGAFCRFRPLFNAPHIANPFGHPLAVVYSYNQLRDARKNLFKQPWITTQIPQSLANDNPWIKNIWRESAQKSTVSHTKPACAVAASEEKRYSPEATQAMYDAMLSADDLQFEKALKNGADITHRFVYTDGKKYNVKDWLDKHPIDMAVRQISWLMPLLAVKGAAKQFSLPKDAQEELNACTSTQEVIQKLQERQKRLAKIRKEFDTAIAERLNE